MSEKTNTFISICENRNCRATFRTDNPRQKECFDCLGITQRKLGVIVECVETVAAEAAVVFHPNSTEAILENRESHYGDFDVQSHFIQQMKRYVRSTPNFDDMNSRQAEAIDAIVMKLSRILHGDPNVQDSWRDIAGYAELGAGWKSREARHVTSPPAQPLNLNEQ